MTVRGLDNKVLLEFMSVEPDHHQVGAFLANPKFS
jgi:hypothetical protein